MIRLSPGSFRKKGPAAQPAGLTRTGRVRPVTAGQMSGRGPGHWRSVSGPGSRQARWYRGTPAQERARRPRAGRERTARTYHHMSVYPRAETAKAAGQAAGGVPAQPSFPELEEGVLAYWAAGDTFQQTVAAAPAGAGVRLLRRAAVRQRAAALRAPHHRLRQGRGTAVPDHAGQPGGAPVRLGLPRPARRGRGGATARDLRQGRDHGHGHRQVQRGVPRLGTALHPGVARLRHPPGSLGRLRPRLQDARHLLHGERHVGVQSSYGTRASSTRASRSCRTAGGARRRCPITSCGWTTTSTRTGRTRR